MRRTFISVALASLFAALVPVAAAITFPDVPSSHLHHAGIVALAEAGVVKGNPDGDFLPNKLVNRAEFLTMLYRAKGLPTNLGNDVNCFSDVKAGVWYAGVVCNAVANKYVQGYDGNVFRPEKSVNRVEALKMISLVFDFPEATMPGVANPGFTDVSYDAWYGVYLTEAFRVGALPMPGLSGSKFYPDWPLTRGEAASLIHNALNPYTDAQASSASSTQSEMTRSSRSATASASSAPSVTTINVDFPFNDDGTFQKKLARVYPFSVSATTHAQFNLSVDSGALKEGAVCRLYRLNKEGFSLEYYIGHRMGKTCTLKVTLSPGSYQLEIQPASPDASFTLTTKTIKGDGNDGFSAASKLVKGNPKTGELSKEDIADWYTFTLAQEATMSVELSNADNLRCMIYAMEDVDLYGFSGPVCNETYLFPKGTYVIGVQHRDEKLDDQSFSIWYK